MPTPLSPYSAELQEFFYSSPPKKTVYETLELRHSSFAQPARVVNDPNDLIATLEADAPVNPLTAVTFSKCNFRFTLPESSDSLPSCQVEIENVSGILMPYLNEAVGIASLLQMSYRQFYSDDLTAPGFVINGLTVKRITAGILKVTGQVGFEDFLGRAFPLRFYNLTDFPGLAS